ncbi:hypothetical protein KAI65_04380 [Candidatus Parcubacteria bacterium]|nr:hypothetical protein [Candidatus Parcubacteria bacterium]
MLYAWEDPERIEKDQPCKKFINPTLSFSVLLPARHEEKVIANTIQGIYDANYPKRLKEILVICKSDDLGTINVVRKKINQIRNGKNSIKLIIFRGGGNQ